MLHLFKWPYFTRKIAQAFIYKANSDDMLVGMVFAKIYKRLIAKWIITILTPNAREN